MDLENWRVVDSGHPRPRCLTLARNRKAEFQKPNKTLEVCPNFPSWCIKCSKFGPGRGWGGLTTNFGSPFISDEQAWRERGDSPGPGFLLGPSIFGNNLSINVPQIAIQCKEKIPPRFRIFSLRPCKWVDDTKKNYSAFPQKQNCIRWLENGKKKTQSSSQCKQRRRVELTQSV